MNIAVALGCLVTIAVLEGVTGMPELLNGAHREKRNTDVCFEIGGTSIGGQCLFLSSEYDLRTWVDAIKACESKGQQLAIPLDFTALKAYHERNYGYYEAFWLGGSDSANEGSWVWINGSSFNSFPWDQQQPDNGMNYGDPSGNGQDCLAVGWRHTFDDKACTEENRYICELKGDCVDKSKSCENWKGECEKQSYYMHTFCRKTCKQCDKPTPTRFFTSTTELSIADSKGPCEDKHKLCSHWADVGECKVNPNSMLKTCRKSCKTCGQS